MYIYMSDLTIHAFSCDWKGENDYGKSNSGRVRQMNISMAVKVREVVLICV